MLKKDIEKYVINDTKEAINYDTNEVVDKEQVINSFEALCLREDCKNVERKGNDTLVKYILEFKDNSAFEVSMHRNYYDKANYYVSRLDTSYEAKKVILDEKIANRNKQLKEKLAKAKLVAAGIGIGILLVNAPNIAGKIVEADNQKFEQEYIESGAQEMHDRLEEQKNHEAALEQFYNDSYEEGQIKTR